MSFSCSSRVGLWSRRRLRRLISEGGRWGAVPVVGVTGGGGDVESSITERKQKCLKNLNI